MSYEWRMSDLRPHPTQYNMYANTEEELIRVSSSFLRSKGYTVLEPVIEWLEDESSQNVKLDLVEPFAFETRCVICERVIRDHDSDRYDSAEWRNSAYCKWCRYLKTVYDEETQLKLASLYWKKMEEQGKARLITSKDLQTGELHSMIQALLETETIQIIRPQDKRKHKPWLHMYQLDVAKLPSYSQCKKALALVKKNKHLKQQLHECEMQLVGTKKIVNEPVDSKTEIKENNNITNESIQREAQKSRESYPIDTSLSLHSQTRYHCTCVSEDDPCDFCIDAIRWTYE